MKISFIQPHLKLYGGIRRIIELANRLTERGHDVTIFHSDGSPCEWMKCIAKIKDYKSVLKEEHDVLVLTHPPSDYPIFKKAKARLKIYYVLALYERSLLKGINLKICLPWDRHMLFIRNALYSPYLILSNATWMYYWLKKNMNIDSKLLLGGVNFEMFRPIEVKRNPNEIHILCSGEIRERKGTKTILKAMEIVKKEVSKVALDTYYDKGISQKDMAKKYSSADIFVDAQWYAGWNNPVAEAMACKVPVVCTDIGGVRDFAFHEKTALLVPPEDPQAMALAVLRLIRDDKLREKLRENAYKHIKTFDWDISAENMEKILLSELNKYKEYSQNIRKQYRIVNFILENISNILFIGYKIAIPIYRLIKRKKIKICEGE